MIFTSTERGFPPPTAGFSPPPTRHRGEAGRVCRGHQGGCGCRCSGAWAAFPAWRDLEPDKRADILLKIADVIDENKELLATIESMDNGKPIRETLAVDIPMAADHFRYFAGCIQAEEGSANILGKDTLSLILREPIGVVGRSFHGTSHS